MITQIDVWIDGNLVRFNGNDVTVFREGRADIKPSKFNFFELRRALITAEEQLDNMDGS